MDHAARQVDQVSGANVVDVEEPPREFGGHRLGRLDVRGVVAGEEPVLLVAHLDQVELVEARVHWVVVGEGVGDPHPVRVQAAEDVGPVVLEPREEDASVGAGLGGSTAWDVRDVRVPVRPDRSRYLVARCVRDVEDERRDRGRRGQPFSGTEHRDVAYVEFGLTKPGRVSAGGGGGSPPPRAPPRLASARRRAGSRRPPRSPRPGPETPSRSRDWPPRSAPGMSRRLLNFGSRVAAHPAR